MSSHNKKLAIVPIEELEKLEALEELEDIEEARLAIKEIEEEGSVSFEEMQRRLA